MRKAMSRFLLVLLVGAGGAVACEESTSPPAANEVQVQDDQFNPSSRTVTVSTTVTWTWTGNNTHNVTWVGGSPGASATQTSGTYQRTFDAAGSFDYYCSIHGTPTTGMRGSVTVN